MTIESMPGALCVMGFLMKEPVEQYDKVRLTAQIKTDDGFIDIQDDMTPDELSDGDDTHFTWSYLFPNTVREGTYPFAISIVHIDIEGESGVELVSPYCDNKIIIHEGEV